MRILPSNNIALLLIAAVYAAGTGAILLLSAELIFTGANTTGPNPSAIFLSWCTMCASSVYWWPAAKLLFQHVRRPIREEETILQAAMQQLAQRSGDMRVFRVLVTDSPMVNASASGNRTWVISTGTLTICTTEEIAAILAHEKGHHRSLDTACSSAISLSVTITRWLSLPAQTLCRSLITCQVKKFVARMILLAIILLYFGWKAVILLVAIVVLAYGRQWLLFILHPLYLAVCRRTEYRQDAYAQSLGYGPALRSAFLKMIPSGQMIRTSWWHLTFHSTHPVTHDRIRRLDALTTSEKDEYLRH